MDYTFTITVKDIYRTVNPEIPKGYKVVGFRIPTKGSNEMFLTNDSAAVYSVRDFFPGKREPRLILEKLPEKRTLEIENCHRCPHFTSFGYCHHPNKTTKGNYVPDYGNIIPEWCPLSIAKS